MTLEILLNRKTTSLRNWTVDNAPKALFVVSLFANLAAVVIRRNFSSVMTWENGEIARNLIQGAGYSAAYLTGTTHPTSVMAPVYAFFLASVYWVFGVTEIAFVFIQVLQAIVGAGAVVLLYLVGRRLFGPMIGLLAGGLMAVYPDYIYAVTVVHQLVFTTFLIILLIYTLLRFDDVPTLRRAVIVGGVLGFTILTFPMAMVFSPLIALWILFVRREVGLREGVTLAAVVATTAVVLVAPWSIRNTIIHSKFVLMKLIGWNFWRGNVPPAIYTGVPIPPDAIEPSLRARLQTMTEAQADSLFFSPRMGVRSRSPARVSAEVY
jgi:4-amino-4-deoxy-L-arabinose transferase-like glycosyltransferase